MMPDCRITSLLHSKDPSFLPIPCFLSPLPMCLCSYDDRTGSYVPHAKPAIKQRVEQQLRDRARR